MPPRNKLFSGFLLSLKRNRLGIARGECVGIGVRHGKIHLRGFGGAEITVRAVGEFDFNTSGVNVKFTR